MTKPNFKEPKLLRDQIYHYLRNRIRGKNHKPGVSISINKLSKELGVSRTPLREALIQLQADGFVTILPQRGVQINTLGLRDVLNIYEILGGLESRVVMSVFHKIGSKGVRDMENLNAEMETLLDDVKLRHFYACNLKFHNVYLKLSENKELLHTVKILKLRLYDFYLVNYGMDWKRSNLKEHREFIELVKKGDPGKAAEYLRDVHWEFQYPEIFGKPSKRSKAEKGSASREIR